MKNELHPKDTFVVAKWVQEILLEIFQGECHLYFLFIIVKNIDELL